MNPEKYFSVPTIYNFVLECHGPAKSATDIMNS